MIDWLVCLICPFRLFWQTWLLCMHCTMAHKVWNTLLKGLTKQRWFSLRVCHQSFVLWYTSQSLLWMSLTYQSCFCHYRTHQIWTQTPERNVFWHPEDSLWCSCQRHTGEGCTAQDQSTNLWWRNGKFFPAMCVRSTLTELLWHSVTFLIKGLLEHFKYFYLNGFSLECPWMRPLQSGTWMTCSGCLDVNPLLWVPSKA